MREVKFRAVRGKDIIGEYTLEEIYQSGAQSESDAYWGNDEDKLNLNPDHIYKEKSEEPVVFYQYTGLKDKNGVEIWEGDLLGNGYLFIGEVLFDNGMFTCEDMHGVYIDRRANGRRRDFEELEVIGNIYEHGYLLENESKLL